MDALTVVIIISFLLVGGLMFISSIFDVGGRRGARAKKAATGNGQNESQSMTKWRSVKISPGLISCDNVGYLANKTFLASDAPSLPLENCIEKDCRCKYIHLDDRRSGGDRRVVLGEFGEFLPIQRTERRLRMGRRAADLAA